MIRKYLLLSTDSFLFALFTSTLWYMGYMAANTTSSCKIATISITLILWMFDYCPVSGLVYVGASTFYEKYALKMDPLNEKILWF